MGFVELTFKGKKKEPDVVRRDWPFSRLYFCDLTKRLVRKPFQASGTGGGIGIPSVPVFPTGSGTTVGYVPTVTIGSATSDSSGTVHFEPIGPLTAGDSSSASGSYGGGITYTNNITDNPIASSDYFGGAGTPDRGGITASTEGIVPDFRVNRR